MKRLIYYFFIFSATLIFCSCGKDGAPGADGTTGAQGQIGPIGPSGSIIYSGASSPEPATGNTGDFYLNLSTGQLYGPKTDAGWGTGISLVGPIGSTGAEGAPGSQIYSGSGAPAPTKGINGDYYIDIANYLLYGPKTTTGWGVPVSVQGNANVLTDVFTLSASQWLYSANYSLMTGVSTSDNYLTRYYVRSNNSITQNVLDDGMVLVYFTPDPVNNPNEWAPLPFQFPSLNAQYNFNFVYVTAPGQVTLEYFFSAIDPTATLPLLSTYAAATYKFKIVAVTGKTGVFMVAHHINLNNYQDVSKVLGLWQQDKLGH